MMLSFLNLPALETVPRELAGAWGPPTLRPPVWAPLMWVGPHLCLCLSVCVCNPGRLGLFSRRSLFTTTHAPFFYFTLVMGNRTLFLSYTHPIIENFKNWTKTGGSNFVLKDLVCRIRDRSTRYLTNVFKIQEFSP
jgi:hypothetical protein